MLISVISSSSLSVDSCVISSVELDMESVYDLASGCKAWSMSLAEFDSCEFTCETIGLTGGSPLVLGGLWTLGKP